MGNTPSTEDNNKALDDTQERDTSTPKNTPIHDGEINSFTAEDLEYGIVHSFKGIPRYASS